MSSYPDAFRINCVGDVSCNNNLSICENKPVVLENNKPVSTTTACLPYKAPKEVIQDNKVDYSFSNSNTWSNTRGYGNIVVGTSDNNNNIHGRIHPWNRITPLSSPYDSPAVVKNAWSMNKIKYNRN